jgi:hypothetical protein
VQPSERRLVLSVMLASDNMSHMYCDGRTLRRVQTLPDNRVRTQVLMEAYVIYYN